MMDYDIFYDTKVYYVTFCYNIFIENLLYVLMLVILAPYPQVSTIAEFPMISTSLTVSPYTPFAALELVLSSPNPKPLNPKPLKPEPKPPKS